MILLQAEHLQKTHGMKVIFDDLSLSIASGGKNWPDRRQWHGQEYAAAYFGRLGHCGWRRNHHQQ